MIFTDLIFLFGFLPIAFVLYLPFRNKRFANGLLLVLSLLFYGWGHPKNLFVLLFVLVWNYCSALIIAGSEGRKRKVQFIFSLIVNLLILLMYKYLNPSLAMLAQAGIVLPEAGLIMPAGLSFYMFSCLSYLIDVYTKKAAAQTNFISFGIFAAFFGRVNMGPIASYTQMEPQLTNHPVTKEKFAKGGPLFFQGLFMKVLLADNLAIVFSGLAGNTTWLGNLIYGFSYFFQLYLDFAGYSRMARGLGYFFGFEIPANFLKPYTASSVQEFWRRWHISLTSWFRQYIYIPLGGNRCTKVRWVMNILIVWLLTGIWHGSSWTFVIWGIFQGLLIVLERLWLRKQTKALPVFWKHAWVIVTQLIGWTMFCSPDVLAALGVIGRYFGFGVSGLYDASALYWLMSYGLVFILAVFVSSNLPAWFSHQFAETFHTPYQWVRIAGYAFVFILCIACLVSATNQTFLYAVF